MGKANQFLKETFIPQFNERFQVKPLSTESAFIPYIDSHRELDDILCLQEQRTVNKDNTVSYCNRTLQIQKDPSRYSFAKTHVKVHEYSDGMLSIFYGPRCIGRYDAQGQPLLQI